MIAHLSGAIAEKFGAGGVVVDVHGVGYEVSVAAGDFEAVSLGQDAKFYTYHHVRVLLCKKLLVLAKKLPNEWWLT